MKNGNDNLKEKAMDPKELESISGGGLLTKQYSVNWDICKGNEPNACGKDCIKVGCATGALEWVDDPCYNKPRITWWLYNCSGCGDCARACPCNAIH